MSQGRQIVLVCVAIRRWHNEFAHRMDALSRRTGQALLDLAVREQTECPRNHVLCGIDPDKAGRVLVFCNPSDREAVDARLKAGGCRLVAVEAVSGRAV